ncbi:MAG: MASE4 domain-containing protein [Solirubrobacterales bacterium]
MDSQFPATTLTDAVPAKQQRLLAFALAAILVLYSAAVLPFSLEPGPVIPSFIGVYQTAVIICDLLTATLLLIQAYHVRQVGSLVLGAGYLFTAAAALAHELSFPGLFSPTGLIGGSQATNWLWIFWHGGFPIFALGYAVLDRRGTKIPPGLVRPVSTLAIISVVALVALGVLLGASDYLPHLVVGQNFDQNNDTGIGPALIALCAGALLLVARERGRTVIKLWLLVTLVAFTLDVFHTLHSEARYTVGWYAARGNSFVASILILAVYLVESGVLMRHWVRSSTQLAETNARLMAVNAELEQSLGERRRAEADLRSAKDRAEEVLSSITDGFYALDREWRLTFLNQRAQSVLGKTPAEVIGQPFLSVFPQAEGTGVHEIYRRVMTRRQPEHLDLISPILKRWTSFTVYPAGDGGISVYFHDISERKAGEEALIIAKEEAERANRAKSHFLAAASHDLRQPVQSLFFFHEILAAKLKSHPAAPVLAPMQAALGALKSLLDGLLDISRLHAGTVEVDLSVFPVSMLLQRLVAEHAPQAEAQGIALRVIPSSAWVRSDMAQLERILRNLVDNALKYTHAGGAVLLGCRHAGDSLRILVVDTGPGIPADRQEAVFEEFIQLGNPERDRAKGLGLGLAIVRHLARLLGHEVGLVSQVGHGTTFSVTVPLARPRREKGPLPVSVSARPAAGLALVVDDEALILLGMRSMLETWGWEVLAAECGAEAMRLMAGSSRAPDVIIADYRLRGDETGVKVIRDLHGVCGVTIPAVVLTGDTSPDRMAECANSGFQLLHKPVDAAALHSALERVRA